MTDIKERLRLVAQDPRKAPELQELMNDAAAEIERLEEQCNALENEIAAAIAQQGGKE